MNETPHTGLLLKRSRTTNLFGHNWTKRRVNLTIVETTSGVKQLLLQYSDLNANLKGEMIITGARALKDIDSKTWCFAATSLRNGAKDINEWEGLLTTTDFVVFSAGDEKKLLEWTYLIDGCLTDIIAEE